MRNFKSVRSRLDSIEGEHDGGNFILGFADASTRGVHVAKRYRLRLLLDCFARAREEEARTESDALLNLMEAAVDIKGDRLFQTVFAAAQSIGQQRKEKQS